MEDITTTFAGAIITFISVEKNKVLECEKDCFNKKSCNTKHSLMINPNEKNLRFTEVIIDIFNPTKFPWIARRKYWSLVDCNAYTYSPSSLCFQFSNSRIQDKDELCVEPHTKTRIALRFPQLEKDVYISSVLFSNNGKTAKLEIAPLKPEIIKLVNSVSEESTMESPQVFDPEAHRFDYMFNKLERDCHSRTHNILIPKEMTKLENSINDTLFSLEQHLRTLSKEKADSYRKLIEKIMLQYETELKVTKKTEKEKASLNSKIDDLYNLTDREFEEWTADLFSALGFEVTLTPKSGDKGIDVICRKDGKITVVQCKKYKGVVGSPEIQKFLGAIQNAEADEGYFVTTGTFSIGAEKAAKDTKIVLCDKIKIRELIEMALT